MSMLGITWQGSVTGEATGIAILCVWAKKGKDKGARGKVHVYAPVVPGGEFVRKQAGAEEAAQN